MIFVYIVGVLVCIVGAGAFFGAPYVPSKRGDVRRMFEALYVLSPEDTLLDIGSGDGVVLREASRRGARAIGYEINPVFYLVSRWFLRSSPRANVRWANAWRTPFPDSTTVVYIFSVHKDGPRVIRTLQAETNRLGRSLVLLCYGNPLPGYTPAETYEAYFLYIFQPLHLKEA